MNNTTASASFGKTFSMLTSKVSLRPTRRQIMIAGLIGVCSISSEAGAQATTQPTTPKGLAGKTGWEAFGPTVSTATSELDVRATGNAEQNRVNERRARRHSSLQPAGRFVIAGQTLTITVPQSVEGLTLRIGVDGVYSGLNGGVEKTPSLIKLSPGDQTLSAPQDGLVHLIDEAPAGTRTTHITVAGGKAVPTFIRGTTDSTAFDGEVQSSNSPFVTFIGQRFTADMQRWSVKSYLNKSDAENRTKVIDRVVDLSDSAWGFKYTGSDTASRGQERLRIVSPDSSAGYANAGHDKITFQTNTGAAKEILQRPADDMWGLWHEVGHTYQPDIVNWPGMGEVAVNVNSLAVQRAVSAVNRLDQPSNIQAAKNFLALPDGKRNYAEADVWTKLYLLEQLTRAFGTEFYARLAQEDRVAAYTGKTEGKDIDVFALRAAKLSNRNLNPFFSAWGVTLTNKTVTELDMLAPLRHHIWENFDSSKTAIEQLVSCRTGTARIATSGAAALGQRTLGASLDASVSNISVGGQVAGEMTVVANNVGIRAGKVEQVITGSDGTPNILFRQVNVWHNNDIEIRGLGDKRHAVVTLDPADRKFHTFQLSSGSVHSYFPNKEYVGALLIASDGSVLASASVKGTETTTALVKAFEGIEYHEGDRFIIRHLESKTRLLRWDGGRQVAGSEKITQEFIIRRGALISL